VAYLLFNGITAQEGGHFAISAYGSGQPEAPVDGAGPGAAYQLILGGIYALEG